MSRPYTRVPCSHRELLRPSNWVIPVAALVLAILAGFAITGLVGRENSDREAQLLLETVQTQLNTLQGAPYASGQLAAVAVVKTSMRQTELAVDQELARLPRSPANEALRRVSVPLRQNFAVLEQLRELVAHGKPQVAYLLDPRAQGLLATVSRELEVAEGGYRERAENALTATTIGSVGVISVLLLAFMFFYLSALRSRATNARLLARSQSEAMSDALTGLGNRRSLYDALGSMTAPGSGSGRLAVILLDLDGFKAYNDTFGHLSGDAMLGRLGERLSSTLSGAGRAFRIGGDESCVLVVAGSDGGESMARFAAAALSEEGDGFRIGCSYGIAVVQRDGTDIEHVLGLADQRMYEYKRQAHASARRGLAAAAPRDQTPGKCSV